MSQTDMLGLHFSEFAGLSQAENADDRCFGDNPLQVDSSRNPCMLYARPVILGLDSCKIRNAVACTDEAIIVGLLQSQKCICVSECSADEADCTQGKWQNPLVPFA